MCWKTQLQDPTGNLQIKIWDKPRHEFFQITVDKMRCYWEEGHEHQERRSHVLSVLNAQLGVEVLCNCKASVWSYGFKERKHETQVNVNSIEIKHPAA